jgi:hypothetical protein
MNAETAAGIGSTGSEFIARGMRARKNGAEKFMNVDTI